MRKHVWLVLLLLALAGGVPPLFGWGNDGHAAVNGAAAERLPPSMPAFLRNGRARLEYLASEPDRWREPQEFAVKNAQEPDHYIDWERLAGVAELPRGRYEYYKLLYERRAARPLPPGVKPDDLLPERVGLQPYITLEIYDRLKVAFRDYRLLQQAGKPTDAVEQNIIFYAGWLGHYVADGANPLHTTIQYDGWLGANPHRYTTERGIHRQMEGQFVADNLARLSFAAMVSKPVVMAHPWEDYLQYLRKSNARVEQVYQLEKAGGFTGAGTAESCEFVRERLAGGAQMLLNLWYTAWVESGKRAAGAE